VLPLLVIDEREHVRLRKIAVGAAAIASLTATWVAFAAPAQAGRRRTRLQAVQWS
jgi:hypothetical protein